MEKYLTVGQLINELNKYDSKCIPVILQEGNDHYAPIAKYDILVEENVYFPDFNIQFPDNTIYLRIGVI